MLRCLKAMRPPGVAERLNGGERKSYVQLCDNSEVDRVTLHFPITARRGSRNIERKRRLFFNAWAPLRADSLPTLHTSDNMCWSMVAASAGGATAGKDFAITLIWVVVFPKGGYAASTVFWMIMC